MINEKSLRSGRCLAEIEGNLREAEKAFEDADARFKQAETDRRMAVEIINRHQAEIDDAIRQLRDRSIPGTHWSDQPPAEDEPLMLNSDDMVSNSLSDRSTFEELASSQTKQAISRDLERLRSSANTDESDPVLKVVANPAK